MPVEFEIKLDISMADGWTRLEFHSFDAYNEASKLVGSLNLSTRVKDTIQAVFLPIKFTGIVKTSGIAKHMESGFPDHH